MFYYSFLILGAQIGLPLVLVTTLFARKQTQRHPTYINLIASWIFYGVPALFLLYSGQGIAEHQRPEFVLCLVQAGSIYGGSAFAGMANVALVVQLWLEIKRSRLANNRSVLNLLVIIPWACFIGFFGSTLLLGLRDPSLVSIKWVFYCTLSSNILIDLVSGVSVACIFVLFVFAVAIIRLLFASSLQSRTANKSLYFRVIRVALYALYSLAAFIASAILVFRPALVAPYIFLATLPLATALVFGTQTENLQIWFKYCWKRRKATQINTLESMGFQPDKYLVTSRS